MILEFDRAKGYRFTILNISGKKSEERKYKGRADFQKNAIYDYSKMCSSLGVFQ